MKKWKGILCTAISAASAVAISNITASGAGTEDQLNAYMYVVTGPLRSNTSAYDSWSTNEVWNLYMDQNLASDDVGYRLVPDYITQQTPDLTNNTLWFVIRLVSKNPTNMFSLDMLQFSELSSDPGNTMSDHYSPIGVTDPIYSGRALGVIWAAGGPRISDTILDYQDATNLVNEIDFIGMESAYYQYPLTTVSTYIYGFTNFLVTVKCQVIGPGSNVLATVQRTLQIRGNPLQPILSITNQSTNVVIGFNMETNRTAVIKSSMDLTAPFSTWSTESTVNAGDQVVRAKNDQHRYFRAVLE